MPGVIFCEVGTKDNAMTWCLPLDEDVPSTMTTTPDESTDLRSSKAGTAAVLWLQRRSLRPSAVETMLSGSESESRARSRAAKLSNASALELICLRSRLGRCCGKRSGVPSSFKQAAGGAAGFVPHTVLRVDLPGSVALLSTTIVVDPVDFVAVR